MKKVIGWRLGMRGKSYLNTKKSPHYAKINSMLHTDLKKLGKAGVLLGARYGALTNGCDNCKTDLNTYTVVILKPIPPRQYHSIHILCEACRLVHAKEVKYYLYLNK